MTLGNKLQTLRKQKGLSQEQLAEQLGVSRQAVSKWELNTTLPETENIIKIKNIFGVSFDYLLDENITEITDKVETIEITGQPANTPKTYNHTLHTILVVIGVLVAVYTSRYLPSFLLAFLIYAANGFDTNSVASFQVYALQFAPPILLAGYGISGLFFIMAKKVKNKKHIEKE